MRWHKDKRVKIEDVLRYPADLEEWKHFNFEFSDFSLKSQNVHLGLALDGLNMFNHMNTSYGMWTVVLISYNLSPWKYVKESKFTSCHEQLHRR